MKRIVITIVIALTMTVFLNAQTNPGINSSWVNVIEGGGNSAARRIISDGDVVYASGDYVGEGQIFERIELPVKGNGVTGLVTKMNSDGEILWTLSFMGDNMDVVLDLAMAKDGNLLVLGWTASEVMYLDGNEYPNSGPFTANTFILKVNKDTGSVIWIRETESPKQGSVWGNKMDISDDGNIYVTGTYDGDFTYQGQTLSSDDHIYEDVFVMKLTADGEPLWMKGFCGDGQQSAQAIATATDNSVFLCLDYEVPIMIGDETLPFEGSQNSWGSLIKLDSNGNPIKFMAYGNANYPTSSKGVKIDPNGNVYCSILFSESITISGKEIFTIGEQNTVLVKFDKDLNYISDRVMGTNNFDQAFGLEQGNDMLYLSIQYATFEDFICDAETNQKIDKVAPGCGGYAIVAYDYDLDFVKGESFNSQNIEASRINPPIRFGISGDNIYLGSDYSGDNELILGTVYTTEPEHGNAYMMKYNFLNPNGINDPQNTIAIKMYPNPATSTLSISMNEKIVTYNVYSVEGKKVSVPMTDNVLNVSSLKAGLYIISITTENGIVNHSFIKR